MWFGVREHNDVTLGFYRHLGFEVLGPHAFYIGETRNTDLLMKRKTDPRD